MEDTIFTHVRLAEKHAEEQMEPDRQGVATNPKRNRPLHGSHSRYLPVSLAFLCHVCSCFCFVLGVFVPQCLCVCVCAPMCISVSKGLLRTQAPASLAKAHQPGTPVKTNMHTRKNVFNLFQLVTSWRLLKRSLPILTFLSLAKGSLHSRSRDCDKPMIYKAAYSKRHS